MADSSIEVTPGSGAEVDTRTQPGGDHRQVVVVGDPVTTATAQVTDDGAQVVADATLTELTEALLQFLRLANGSAAFAAHDGVGRARTFIDGFNANATLATVTTVGAVTTVASVTSVEKVGKLGVFPADYAGMSQGNAGVAQLRSNIITT